MAKTVKTAKKAKAKTRWTTWFGAALLGLCVGAFMSPALALQPGPAPAKLSREKAVEIAKGLVPGQLLASALGLDIEGATVWRVTILEPGGKPPTVVLIDAADGRRR